MKENLRIIWGELEYKYQYTLVLGQWGYIKKLLEHFGMFDCNPKATPLDIDLNLSLLDCPDEVMQKSRGSIEN